MVSANLTESLLKISQLLGIRFWGAHVLLLVDNDLGGVGAYCNQVDSW